MNDSVKESVRQCKMNENVKESVRQSVREGARQ